MQFILLQVPWVAVSHGSGKRKENGIILILTFVRILTNVGVEIFST